MSNIANVSRAKLRDVFRPVSYAPRTLRLVWDAAKGWTIAGTLLLVIQGLLPAAFIYLTKLLINHLALVLGTDTSGVALRPILVLLVALAAVMLLTELLQSVSDWIRTAQSELIQDHINGMLHRQAIRMDLSFFESPEYYNLLEQSSSEASVRSHALLDNTGNLIQHTTTLIAMAALLIPYSPLLPVILLVSILPAFYVILRFDQRYYHWWHRTTIDRRRLQYYDSVMTYGPFAAELRLFGLGPHFQALYAALRRRLRTERLAQLQRQSIARLGAGFITLCCTGVALAWMIWRATQGMVTLGDLALFYQAFDRGQTLMRLLMKNVGQIYTNSLFLGNLFNFLEIRPQVTEPERPIAPPDTLKHGITFDKVTFEYPGSPDTALRNLNLTIPAGKIVAIVGTNGAGKTTLIKLLCRFYDPQEGRILLDGIDIRHVSLEQLRRMITVLFQFPVNFHTTVAKSITLGNIDAVPDHVEIEAAARSAGAHELVSSLPNGYDTQLGKWFPNGVELSGGEWQRIAMARAFLRPSPILLLDEPTSAMDSWAEADWFERLRKLAKSRTALVITHRFTIAMRADIIHVMDGGQIVESGSHSELLARGGLYAQSWNSQMRASSDYAEELHHP